MRQRIEWNDNPALFDVVCIALKDAGLNVFGMVESGSYGERGYLDIRMDDGRRLRLDISEVDA